MGLPDGNTDTRSEIYNPMKNEFLADMKKLREMKIISADDEESYFELERTIFSKYTSTYEEKRFSCISSAPEDWWIDDEEFFLFVISCLHEENIDEKQVWSLLAAFGPIWYRLFTQLTGLSDYNPNPIPKFAIGTEDWQTYPICEEYEESVNDDDLYDYVMVEKLRESKREILDSFDGKYVSLSGMYGSFFDPINIPTEDVSFSCRIMYADLGEYTSLHHWHYEDDGSIRIFHRSGYILQVDFHPEDFEKYRDEEFLESIANVTYSWDQEEVGGSWVKGKIERIWIGGDIEDVMRCTKDEISLNNDWISLSLISEKVPEKKLTPDELELEEELLELFKKAQQLSEENKVPIEELTWGERLELIKEFPQLEKEIKKFSEQRDE